MLYKESNSPTLHWGIFSQECNFYKKKVSNSPHANSFTLSFSHWNATSTNAIGGGKCTLENILKVGKNNPVSCKSVMYLKKKKKFCCSLQHLPSPRKGQWRSSIIQTVTHLVLPVACQVLSVEIFVRCSCFLNNFLFVILSQSPGT